MNESYPQPSLPAGVEAGILKGLYRLEPAASGGSQAAVRLLGSGAILREVIAAAELLRSDWQIDAEVWSVTSFTELAREARAVERWNRLHPEAPPRASHLDSCLNTDARPIVAATDYVRGYPQLVAEYLRARYVTLGTDGFGRSDTRARLRRFFEVDRFHVAIAALAALGRDAVIPARTVSAAIGRYAQDPETAPAWMR
jgi:pyruvate dehydrogenase E1 component